MAQDDSGQDTRQERRENKLRKKREQMRQHGKNLARIYRDVIMKRMKPKEEGK